MAMMKKSNNNRIPPLLELNFSHIDIEIRIQVRTRTLTQVQIGIEFGSKFNRLD